MRQMSTKDRRPVTSQCCGLHQSQKAFSIARQSAVSSVPSGLAAREWKVKPSGADDVVAHQARELGGVLVVLEQVARARTQLVQVATQLVVDGHVGGHPRRSEAVDDRAFEATTRQARVIHGGSELARARRRGGRRTASPRGHPVE
jgi:hypothetical protein